jgi:hypothetical protein
MCNGIPFAIPMCGAALCSRRFSYRWLSNRHGPALEIGQTLPNQNKGEIVLLHVLELIAGLSMGEEKDFYRKLEKVAEARNVNGGLPFPWARPSIG